MTSIVVPLQSNCKSFIVKLELQQMAITKWGSYTHYVEEFTQYFKTNPGFSRVITFGCKKKRFSYYQFFLHQNGFFTLIPLKLLRRGYILNRIAGCRP